METREHRFLLMGGGCFLAFTAASVVSLNTAEGNFWVMSRHRTALLAFRAVTT